MRLPRRFSLRSLLLLILTGAAAVTAAQKWQPWQLTLTLNPTGKFVKDARFSPDGNLILTHAVSAAEISKQKMVTTVWTRSGQKLSQTEWCLEQSPSGYDGAVFKLGSRWLLLFYGVSNFNVQLVDLKSQKLLFPEKSNALDVSFTDDERHCAVLLRDEWDRYSLAIYDLENAQLMREERAFFTGVTLIHRPRLHVTPLGQQVFLQCQLVAENTTETCLIRYDVKSGVIKRSRSVSSSEQIELLSVARDGSWVSIKTDNAIRLLDTITEDILFEQRNLSSPHYSYSSRYMSHFFFEADGRSLWLDLTSIKPQPKVLVGVDLKAAWVAGDWIAWRDGQTVKLRNFITGYVCELVNSSQDSSSAWCTLRDFEHCLVFNCGSSSSYIFRKDTHSVSFIHGQLVPTPDAKCVYNFNSSEILTLNDGAGPSIRKLRIFLGLDGQANWAPDSAALITFNDSNLARVYSRVRDDAPGGFFRLPELWLALAFFLACIFSVRDDLRRLRSPVR